LGVVSFDPIFPDGNIESRDHDQSLSQSSLSYAIGTKMTWDVQFNTIQRRNLWQRVTEYLISEASQNLASYVAPPLQLTTRMILQTNSTTSKVLDQWFRFIWVQGGGLPIPIPPISLDKQCYKK